VDDDGTEVTPRRSVRYDTLVIAVGSRTNDFGTPGVKRHALRIDTPDDAARVHRRLAGKSLRPFRYRDFGSLVSLGEYSTVGNPMGFLVGGSLLIEGYFARLMYLSLHLMHDYALHGFVKVFLDTLVRIITRRTEPHVKLH
jgi:NADH dehydrogenase FAD-containing subunit